MSRRFEHAQREMRQAMLVRVLLCVLMTLLVPGGAQAQEAAHKVLHIDSYHAGNEWNDRIDAALQETLSTRNIELRIFHMDTKRRSSEEDIQASALAALKAIEEFKPDVVTTSDDPAAQYVIKPYLRDASIPVVFCGLNWDASIYGLPYRNTTGMVEVSPIPQLLRLLRRHARGPRLGFLAEDTEVKHKELTYHERLFGITYDKTYFVTSLAAWKDAFLRAQKEVDMLMILGVGALPDWNLADATHFVEEKSEIPTGTDFEWLTAVSLIGVVKSPQEQGRWVGQATLRILEGVQPSDIPVSHNRDGALFFNERIARRLGIKDLPPLAKAVP